MVNKVKIILASGSLRRRQLLKSLGVSFESISLNTDESYEKGTKPINISKQIAIRKAQAAEKLYKNTAIIAADTIVIIDDNILEKPKDRYEAVKMLKKLSGRWHEVISSVCIIYKGNNTIISEITKVHFKKLDDDLINWYVKTDEPMDKAGAYGIQGYGAMLVDSIEGDFYNVMGLPISRVMGELAKQDIYDVRRL